MICHVMFSSCKSTYSTIKQKLTVEKMCKTVEELKCDTSSKTAKILSFYGKKANTGGKSKFHFLVFL